MFSSALKSFSSNITSNYTISPQPSTTSGPWKIFDAKRKATGKAASVFVFDKKSLDPPGGGLGGRTNAASLKRAHEEILERLKKEASSLARLRHPSILELAEPVEETRYGGLMFATEPVTASLASLLHEKDDQERAGGVGGRGSRYVVEEADGTKRRREVEIDELEIQKGLLQLGKGLEFLHESAGLVHANLTPEAVFVNAKGDWKIAGLGFCGPHESSTSAVASTMAPIALSEVLNHDPRLPRTVQLNLDYTSPDFVLDNSLTTSADIFSLGLMILALYNSPHSSPLSTGGSLSAYKRLFASSSSVPTQNNNFLVPSSHPLPPKLASELLPRLITRRPAQRISAKEFQEASYFDNILVSTIRFLDSLPAKTPNEKIQFMRGLPRIMPQFPKSVLEKKVLPALLEEMKDKDLISPILSNVFVMIKVLPTGKRAFTDQVVPKLREVFIPKKASDKDKERDTSKEAGLMILLENMQTAAENCPGKEFEEDILPIILLALESPTHGIVDAALGTLPHVLPVVHHATIHNEMFPVIAGVFSKTSSLNIKIRGMEAFYLLCGGSENDANDDDGVNGIGIADKKPSTASSSILGKFTVQEKVVPLLKGIKTKEPGVMMAALRVFKQVGEIADHENLVADVLPTLWTMALGPLLNLQQFQAFMALIKKLSGRIEREHIKKLQEIGSSNTTGGSIASGRGGRETTQGLNGLGGVQEEVDFETLVSGRSKSNTNNNDLMNDWGAGQAARPVNARTQSSQEAPMFSWQTPLPTSTTPQPHSMNVLRGASNLAGSRAITPDQTLSSFAALTPASQYSQPLQPSRSTGSSVSSALPMRPPQQTTSSNGSTVDWSPATVNTSTSSWASQRPTQQPMSNGFGTTGANTGSLSSFSLSPPPTSPQTIGQFSAPTQPMQPPFKGGLSQQQQQQQGQAQATTTQPQKLGLDKYESLL